jgi:hypothetical protein
LKFWPSILKAKYRQNLDVRSHFNQNVLFVEGCSYPDRVPCAARVIAKSAPNGCGGREWMLKSLDPDLRKDLFQTHRPALSSQQIRDELHGYLISSK